MAVELPFDVLEHILVRLDVEDLIRCKSVSKSWRSFISTPCFVKAHLKHTYNNDRRDNHQLGHRRVARSSVVSLDNMLCCNCMHIVGSCNGLVCISPTDAQFVLVNPSTREVRNLQTPPFPSYTFKTGIIRNVICWGFGYDSSSDDYKVIAGVRTRFSKNQTLFYVLTLKSNLWKLIGKVKYRRLKGVNGILFRGALYWFMTDDAKKRVIISLDLSTEEFKEIKQPADGQYESHKEHGCGQERDCNEHVLGVLEECLCIYSSSSPLSSKKWVMKSDKWEVYNNHIESRYDVAHKLIMVDSQQRLYSHDVGTRVPYAGAYIRASIFVKSLVSPHTHVSNNNYEGQERDAMGKGANEIVEGGVKTNIGKRKRRCKYKKFLRLGYKM